MDILLNILDALCVITAIVAAILWFKSAKIETPNSFTIHVVKPDMGPMDENPMGGTYMGHAYSNDLVNLANALRRQSELSANAALFASLSAVLQIFSFIIKVWVKTN